MTLPRVYAIVDSALLAARNIAAEEAADALLEAGIRLIQYRHKGHFGRDAFAAAYHIAAACRQSQAHFIVNDRADMARLLDAGVHVGQDDLPPADARAIVGARLLGFSTHNETQFRSGAAEPVDYLAIGPIFATGTKANPDPVVGIEELARLRAFTDKPVVAIGGMTRATAPSVWTAGADTIAVCADLFPPDAGRHAVQERALEWLNL
jgi:thiamine-phosphate pyrophosphorylase